MPIATPSPIGWKRLRRTARALTSIGTSITPAPAAAAAIRTSVSKTKPPRRALRRSRSATGQARMPDALGTGFDGSGAARVARAVVDHEHGRVPPRTRGNAGHGRFLVEHRDDDERGHGPTITAT